jgi:hypothetical protein
MYCYYFHFLVKTYKPSEAKKTPDGYKNPKYFIRKQTSPKSSPMGGFKKTNLVFPTPLRGVSVWGHVIN